MKERIIQYVFFITFLVCLITGLFSFTHENDLFDSLALLVGAMANCLSWIMLWRQRRAVEGNDLHFVTDRRIGIFYILSAGLFFCVDYFIFLFYS